MKKNISVPDSLGTSRSEEAHREIGNNRYDRTQERQSTLTSKQRYYRDNFPNSIFAKGFIK